MLTPTGSSSARMNVLSDLVATVEGAGRSARVQGLVARSPETTGNAHFAASPDDAPGIFAKEFDDLVSLVAQNVSVEVRGSEHVQVVGVLNEFPCVQVDGGVQAQLGDAYGGETRRVVFALHVTWLPTLGPTTIGEVVLRYVTIGEQIEQHETRIPLNVNLVSSDEAAAAGLDTGVSEEVVILRSAKAQRDARGRAQVGDYEGARSVLREAANELRSRAAGSPNAEELERLAADIEEDLPFLEDGAFDASSSKRLHYKQMTSSYRRLQLRKEELERRKEQP